VSESFTSRPLGALDLDSAASLHREAFTELGERGWTRQEIAELLASPGVVGLLLQQDGNEIGFALCRTAAAEAELLTIAIQASFRRLGAGRALLEGVIATALERGAGSLFLEVGDDNPAALALYRQRGFAPVGRRAGYYARAGRPAADAIVMRLALKRGG
jgi:ribosomal-protein-alanine N-acetyltransferase